ncbi:ATP-binding protein [Olivibacter sp. XZL3]|uniref:ATP-binding protein n=1 Tax=Olivibacter sp. XZL3 TaxID=1735116 RepID=UPI001066A84F|nr:AAA family ATPase [Olivibacter sp. XZL3]
MEKLFTKSAFLTEDIATRHVRGLYEKIDWTDRLIGILGARGTGKTTLLLQRIRMAYRERYEAALYISMDDIYFATNTLVGFAEQFRQRGGKILFIDEVHKYPHWSREIKNVYDTYKDLQLVFTGSSIIDIHKQEADLSRRAVFYELQGLSFREYLQFIGVADKLPKYDLSDLLTDHMKIVLSLTKSFRPLQYFGEYLRGGYYPFFLENTNTYLIRLEQVARLIVETELRYVEGFDVGNTSKIMSLLAILAEQVPFKPNISKLSEKIGLSRNTLLQYLHYLSKAKLISLLEMLGHSVSILQKPEKIYLENPNLHYALANHQPNIGAQRESFFLNQLRNGGYLVSLAPASDFFVEGQYTFEIGGKSKKKTQIKDVDQGFIVADDIEVGAYNKIPLWLFGFLY